MPVQQPTVTQPVPRQDMSIAQQQMPQQTQQWDDPELERMQLVSGVLHTIDNSLQPEDLVVTVPLWVLDQFLALINSEIPIADVASSFQIPPQFALNLCLAAQQAQSVMHGLQARNIPLPVDFIRDEHVLLSTQFQTMTTAPLPDYGQAPDQGLFYELLF